MPEPVTSVVGTPAPRPSRPPVATVVQVSDRIADAVGTVCLTYLCVHGRLSGELTLVGICALLGALQGLRTMAGGRVTGAASALVIGGGALGLALLRARGHIAAATLALVLGSSLTACTPAQGQQAGRGLTAIDKVISWVCGVWPGVRAGAQTLLPDSGGEIDASAPASSGGAAP